MAKKHLAAMERELARDWAKNPILYAARVVLGFAIIAGFCFAATIGTVMLLSQGLFQ